MNDDLCIPAAKNWVFETGNAKLHREAYDERVLGGADQIWAFEGDGLAWKRPERSNDSSVCLGLRAQR